MAEIETVTTLRNLGFIALVALTVVVVFLAGFGARWLIDRGASPSDTPPATAADGDAAQPGDMHVYWEAWHILQRDFYGDQPDAQQREHGAIDGLARAYGDPYTRFVAPEPRQREKEQLSGEFGGIGAWITKDDAGNLRLNPMPDRPAEKAGIKKDDILIAVAGKPIAPELTADEAVDLIRGPIGEPVELQVRREGAADPLTFSVVRERIETPSVEWRALEQNPQIGYIAIRQFTERTAGELDRALLELDQQDVQQLGRRLAPQQRRPAAVLHRRDQPFSERRRRAVRAQERRRRTDLSGASMPNAPPTGRWLCWSTVQPPARRRSWPAPCRTAAGPSWSARKAMARDRCSSSTTSAMDPRFT